MPQQPQPPTAGRGRPAPTRAELDARRLKAMPETAYTMELRRMVEIETMSLRHRAWISASDLMAPTNGRPDRRSVKPHSRISCQRADFRDPVMIAKVDATDRFVIFPELS